MHPAFRAAMAETAAAPRRQGPLAPPSGSAVVQVSEDGVTLAVAVAEADGRIVAARHDGAADPAVRAVLDQLCRLIEGVPVQEAAEHGVAYAMEALLDHDQPPPVAGILTPRNAGPAFALPTRLVRALWRTHMEAAGKETAGMGAAGASAARNTFDRPFSPAFLALDAAGKRDLVERHLGAFRQAHGIAEAHLFLHDIDRYDRVVVMFGPGVPAAGKPALMMRLERHLRAATGERLELFVEVAKDDNRIRRL